LCRKVGWSGGAATRKDDLPILSKRAAKCKEIRNISLCFAVFLLFNNETFTRCAGHSVPMTLL